MALGHLRPIEVRFHLGHELPRLVEKDRHLIGGKRGDIGIVGVAPFDQMPLEATCRIRARTGRSSHTRG